MPSVNTLKNRRAIQKHYSSPVWMGRDGDGSWASMVTARISAGLIDSFHINCMVYPGSQGMTNPTTALQWGLALSDSALWCAETAADLEQASILAGIPAKNGSGLAGAGRFARMEPMLPLKL